MSSATAGSLTDQILAEIENGLAHQRHKWAAQCQAHGLSMTHFHVLAVLEADGPTPLSRPPAPKAPHDRRGARPLMTARPAAAAPTDDAPVHVSNRARIEILIAVLLGLFLSALDQTIVGPILPRIVSELHGSDYYTWV